MPFWKADAAGRPLELGRHIGELIRNDIKEDQEGVPLYLDIQLIDTNTCEPVPQVYLDFWHCNATVSTL